jgi:CcmD family protein
MMLIRRVIAAAAAVVLLAAFMPSTAAFQPPPNQGEYLPVEQVPPGQGLPAAPFLITAYIFVWLAAMGYIWSVWQRLNKVEAEMRGLEQRASGRSGTR